MIPNVYQTRRENLIHLRSESEDKWKWHLGVIKIAEHRIELRSEYIRSFQSTLYQTGLTAMNILGKKIQKMLQEKFIELATAYGPVQSFLAMKKMFHWHFAMIIKNETRLQSETHTFFQDWSIASILFQ